ncbi:protein NATD1-like [Liolophura sinensis]|uniref:protein NATD1-like n=1 Tax=Liolophura sinensis TaxID=3198878 RepID=UPI0031587CE5
MKLTQKLFRIVADQSKNFGEVKNFWKQHLTSAKMSTKTSTKTVKDVQHNKEKCEFFLQISEGGQALRNHKALLSYAWVDSAHIDMYHTEVPSIYRGQGVAKLLAKAAFDFVVKEDLKMTLTCTYLQKYFRENPLPRLSE